MRFARCAGKYAGGNMLEGHAAQKTAYPARLSILSLLRRDRTRSSKAKRRSFALGLTQDSPNQRWLGNEYFCIDQTNA